MRALLSCKRLCVFVLPALMAGAFKMNAEITAPELSIQGPAVPADRVKISSSFQAGALLKLESSPDMFDWREARRLHDALYAYPDPAGVPPARRYYRVQASARTAADDWKNQILFPDEVFRQPQNGEGVRWVKFVILTSDPGRVYYQDGARYPFHYD
ncbi:MAG TPA: hypothetical protein VHM91_03680, partial [Verrucomicrobiales bacterium]|nr:hypothetical protein [Verrucomicrobiales bacterium]